MSEDGEQAHTHGKSFKQRGKKETSQDKTIYDGHIISVTAILRCDTTKYLDIFF